MLRRLKRKLLERAWDGFIDDGPAQHHFPVVKDNGLSGRHGLLRCLKFNFDFCFVHTRQKRLNFGLIIAYSNLHL